MKHGKQKVSSPLVGPSCDTQNLVLSELSLLNPSQNFENKIQGLQYIGARLQYIGAPSSSWLFNSPFLPCPQPHLLPHLNLPNDLLTDHDIVFCPFHLSKAWSPKLFKVLPWASFLFQLLWYGMFNMSKSCHCQNWLSISEPLNTAVAVAGVFFTIWAKCSCFHRCRRHFFPRRYPI